jgi:hypothetical protein
MTRRGSHAFKTICSHEAAVLSALRDGRPLPPGVFLVFISIKRLSQLQNHCATRRIGSIGKQIQWRHWELNPRPPHSYYQCHTAQSQTIFVCTLFSVHSMRNILHEISRFNRIRFHVTNIWFVKNVVFWDVTPCGSCKNRCFGRAYRLIFRVKIINELETACWHS